MHKMKRISELYILWCNNNVASSSSSHDGVVPHPAVRLTALFFGWKLLSEGFKSLSAGFVQDLPKALTSQFWWSGRGIGSGWVHRIKLVKQHLGSALRSADAFVWSGFEQVWNSHTGENCCLLSQSRHFCLNKPADKIGLFVDQTIIRVFTIPWCWWTENQTVLILMAWFFIVVAH